MRRIDRPSAGRSSSTRRPRTARWSRRPAGPVATPAPAVTASPDAGNVDGSGSGPELTIEVVTGDTIRATLDDPAAKAWRLVVAGRG